VPKRRAPKLGIRKAQEVHAIDLDEETEDKPEDAELFSKGSPGSSAKPHGHKKRSHSSHQQEQRMTRSRTASPLAGPATLEKL